MQRDDVIIRAAIIVSAMVGDPHYYHPNVTFNVEHVLSCPYGSFPSIRHEIRDITAHLMSGICQNVGTEPVLQPVTDGKTNLQNSQR